MRVVQSFHVAIFHWSICSIGVKFRADPQIHWSASESGFASRQVGKSSSSHFSDFQLRKARKFWQTRNAGRRRSSSPSSLGIGSWQGCGRWGGSWVHVGFASSLSSHWWRGILFDDLVQRSSRFEDVQVQPGNDVHFKWLWNTRLFIRTTNFSTRWTAWIPEHQNATCTTKYEHQRDLSHSCT